MPRANPFERTAEKQQNYKKQNRSLFRLLATILHPDTSKDKATEADFKALGSIYNSGKGKREDFGDQERLGERLREFERQMRRKYAARFEAYERTQREEQERKAARERASQTRREVHERVNTKSARAEEQVNAEGGTAEEQAGVHQAAEDFRKEEQAAGEAFNQDAPPEEPDTSGAADAREGDETGEAEPVSGAEPEEEPREEEAGAREEESEREEEVGGEGGQASEEQEEAPPREGGEQEAESPYNEQELTDALNRARDAYVAAYGQYRTIHREKTQKGAEDGRKTAARDQAEKLKTEYNTVKKTFAEKLFAEKQGEVRRKFEARFGKRPEEGNPDEIKEFEQESAVVKADIFKRLVIDERALLDKAEVDGMPPQEKGIFRKGLERWTGLNKYARIAITTGAMTGGIFALGGVGLSGAALYASHRFARSLLAAEAGLAAGKGVEKLAGKKIRSSKEKNVGSLQQSFSIESLSDADEKYKGILDEAARDERKKLIIKALATIAAGGGAAMGLGMIDQAMFGGGGAGTTEAWRSSGAAGAPSPLEVEPLTEIPGTRVDIGPPPGEEMRMPEVTPLSEIPGTRVEMEPPSSGVAAPVEKDGEIGELPVTPLTELPGERIDIEALKSQVETPTGRMPEVTPLTEIPGERIEIESLGPQPEFSEHIQELATIQKGEGVWHSVRRQLMDQLKSDPEAFQKKFGIVVKPEDLENAAKVKDIANRVTGKLLTEQGIIKPDGTEIRIAKPGVKVFLDADNKVTYEGEGKLTYDWSPKTQAPADVGQKVTLPGAEAELGQPPSGELHMPESQPLSELPGTRVELEPPQGVSGDESGLVSESKGGMPETGDSESIEIQPISRGEARLAESLGFKENEYRALHQTRLGEFLSQVPTKDEIEGLGWPEGKTIDVLIDGKPKTVPLEMEHVRLADYLRKFPLAERMKQQSIRALVKIVTEEKLAA